MCEWIETPNSSAEVVVVVKLIKTAWKWQGNTTGLHSIAAESESISAKGRGDR